MAHYGVLSLHLTGHLTTAMAIARGLEDRGHQITFFSLPDVGDSLRSYGFRMVEIGGEFLPKGSLRELANQQALLKDEAAFGAFLQQMIGLAAISYKDLPPRIGENHIDALLIDQLFPGGSTVADHLKLPYASFASAAPINRSKSLPPPNLHWDYDPSPVGRERDKMGWNGGRNAFRAWTEVENAQRALWNLKPFKDILEDSFSPLAQIVQMPESFDFPREDPPANFSYVGPITHPATRHKVEGFPWNRLDGKQIVYASLGTMQNGLETVFRTIIEACSPLDVQLILSTGGGPVTDLSGEGVPDNAIVVNDAPQYELLSKATLCITHAGLNTTLEALTHGVPLVALPITHDQPGVAARIRWTGCGKSIDLGSLDAVGLREAIVTVLSEPSFREKAMEQRSQIAQLDPVSAACEIIEHLNAGK